MDTTTPPTQLIHILLSITAMSVLIMAAVLTAALALQERWLRYQPQRTQALPPLQTLERVLFQLIGIGFVLLSLSLLSGFLFLDDLFGQRLAHKTVLALLAWVVFAILLWGRYRLGWRGTTAIRWTLSGCGLLALAYFGTKFVIKVILPATGNFA